MSQGTLELANSAALVNSTVEVNAANVLQFSPGVGTFLLGGLSGSKHLDLDDTLGGGAALFVGGNGASTTFSGDITGGGSLTMSGSGTLVLSGSNTYSGGTNVAGGTLIAANNEALADGSDLTIGNGGLFTSIITAGKADPHFDQAATTVPEPGSLPLLSVLLGSSLFYMHFTRHCKGRFPCKLLDTDSRAC